MKAPVIDGVFDFSHVQVLWWFSECDDTVSRAVVTEGNPSVPAWCAHWPKSYELSGSFDWENEIKG